jgi:hypothetical protein
LRDNFYIYNDTNEDKIIRINNKPSLTVKKWTIIWGDIRRFFPHIHLTLNNKDSSISNTLSTYKENVIYTFNNSIIQDWFSIIDDPQSYHAYGITLLNDWDVPYMLYADGKISILSPWENENIGTSIIMSNYKPNSYHYFFFQKADTPLLLSYLNDYDLITLNWVEKYKQFDVNYKKYFYNNTDSDLTLVIDPTTYSKKTYTIKAWEIIKISESFPEHFLIKDMVSETEKNSEDTHYEDGVYPSSAQYCIIIDWSDLPRLKANCFGWWDGEFDINFYIDWIRSIENAEEIWDCNLTLSWLFIGTVYDTHLRMPEWTAYEVSCRSKDKEKYIVSDIVFVWKVKNGYNEIKIPVHTKKHF